MRKTSKTYYLKIILLSFLSLNSSVGKSNSVEILKAKLKETNDDSVKFFLLNQISWKYLQSNLDSAEKYNNILSELAISLKDYKNQAVGLNTYSVIQWYRGDMELALIYVKSALNINTKRNDTSSRAGNLGNIGMLYDNLGQPDSAIYYYEKALNLSKLINNLQVEAKTHVNLALLFTDINNFQLALKHNFVAEELNIKLNNISDLPILYNNIGLIYKMQEISDSAQYYYSKGLLLADSLGLLFSQAKLLQSLGNLHVHDAQYSIALDYFEMSLEISKSLENNYLLADNFMSIGELVHRQGMSSKAIQYYNMSLESAVKAENIHAEKRSLKMLFESHKKTGSYKKALEYLEQYVNKKDSLINDSFSKQLADFEARYESNKKDKELLEKKIEIQAKESTILIIKITLGLLLIGTIGMVWLYLLKRKALKKLIDKNIVISTRKKNVQQLPSEKEKLLFNRLNKYLENEKVYLNHSLTIEELAKTLKTNRTELSSVINLLAKKQFNNFINEFRVNEAINYIADSNYKIPKIEVLAEDVGFKSPSVFYKSFKEISGVTPSFFIKNTNHY